MLLGFFYVFGIYSKYFVIVFFYDICYVSILMFIISIEYFILFYYINILCINKLLRIIGIF